MTSSTLCPNKKDPNSFWLYLRQFLTDCNNSWCVGKRTKFPTNTCVNCPPHPICVDTIPCETRRSKIAYNTEIHFIEPGVTVNGAHDRDILLQSNLARYLTLVWQRVFHIPTEQCTGTPRTRNSGISASSVAWLIPPEYLWPPNSPDLNPVDYSIWNVL